MTRKIEGNPNLERKVQELGDTFVRKSLPDLKSDEVDYSWLDVTAIDRAVAMQNQDSVAHPVILIAGWLWAALGNYVSNIFNSPYENQNKQLIFQCHALKNHGHITYAEYVRLNKDLIGENGSREKFQNTLLEILDPMRESGFIDMRGHIQVTNLIKNGRTTEGLQYLNTVSCLNFINANPKEACFIITPKEALTLGQSLQKSLDRSEFDKLTTEQLESVLARMQILKWVRTLNLTNEQVEQVALTLRSNNHTEFKKVIGEFLELAASRKEGLLKEYYTELKQSLSFLQHRNIFIHFAHGLTTERVVRDWAVKLKALQEEVNTSRSEELHLVLPQLRRLYTIFGHMLTAEEQYFNSMTAFNHTYGDIKLRWEEINDHIGELLGEDSMHRTCGCSHHEVKGEYDGDLDVHPWAQTATTTVGPSRVDTPRVHTHPKKLRVFLGTCRYGNGHNAAIEAIRDYLGKKDFHVQVADTSRDILISEDFVYQYVGKDYSQERIFNTALAGENFALLDMLQSSSGVDVFEGPTETQKRLFRERMFRDRPDIIVADEPINNELYKTVAEELGIPFLYVPTDLDCETRFVTPVADDYEHFKMILPVDNTAVKDSVKGKVPESAMIPLGYPVRTQFIEKPSTESLLLQKAEYTMEDADKLVMVMGGGSGAKSPYFEKTIEAMSRGELDNTHIVAICGNNHKLKEEFEALKEKYPTVANKIHVEGFCNAEKMALLMYLADVNITKPGGSTVAEGLQTQTKMLFKLNSNFLWERVNLEFVRDHGLGNEITDDATFVDTLKTELNREIPEGAADLTPHRSQAESYREIIEEMIDRARRDEGIREKRLQWDREIEIPVLNDFTQAGEKMASANIHFKTMLSHIFPRIQVTEEVVASVESGRPVKICESGEIQITETFQKEEITTVMKHLLNVLKHWNKIETDLTTPEKTRIRRVAGNLIDTCLQRVNFNNQTDTLVQTASELEKHLIAAKMKADGVTKRRFKEKTSFETDRTALLQLAQEYYKTPQAKRDIQNWVLEKTHQARENETEEYISDAFDAVYCALAKPHSVAHARSLKIHRLASAHNQKITYLPNGDMQALVAGSKLPMEAVMNRYQYYQGRIIDKDSSIEHIYSYNLGIIPGSRDLWQDEIPIFKKKEDRKTKDYRMEILTDTTHAWIRMKDPEGNVYSIGKNWSKDHDHGLFSTAPGTLESTDAHEYKRNEQSRKRTVLSLTKAQYERVMQSILDNQKSLLRNETGFNLIDDNCVSFVIKAAEVAGFQIADRPSLIHTLGESHSTIKAIYNSSIIIRILATPFLYTGAILRNIIMYLGGGGRSSTPNPGKLPNRLFNNFWEVFNPYKGMIKHPSAIREWQNNNPKKINTPELDRAVPLSGERSHEADSASDHPRRRRMSI